MSVAVQALFWVGVLAGEDVRRAPASHVASLFDCYADNFDSHLVQALQYRTPALLMDAITVAADQVRAPPACLWLSPLQMCCAGNAARALGMISDSCTNTDARVHMCISTIVRPALFTRCDTRIHIIASTARGVVRYEDVSRMLMQYLASSRGLSCVHAVQACRGSPKHGQSVRNKPSATK